MPDSFVNLYSVSETAKRKHLQKNNQYDIIVINLKLMI